MRVRSLALAAAALVAVFGAATTHAAPICQGPGIRCHASVVLSTTAPILAGQSALSQAARAAVPHTAGASFASANPAVVLPSAVNYAMQPGQLQQVYLSSKPVLKNLTIAIVDAYASPFAQSDMNLYRSYFGLPPMKIKQFDQNGKRLTFPGTVGYDEGWAGEQALDLQMVSAMCPTCPLIYVGADSSNDTDLYAAVATAVKKGAKVVSMSWGEAEDLSSVLTNAADDALWRSIDPEGTTTLLASTGDAGYLNYANPSIGVAADYPASSKHVIAVGGTTLYVNNVNGRASETVWPLAGSGCSGYIARPSWQPAPSAGCRFRVAADVSAVADVATPVWVFLTLISPTNATYAYMFGGTSVAAPLLGGIYAGGYLKRTSVAGVPNSAARGLYPGGANHGLLYDITQGNNDNNACPAGSKNYLCQAQVGYDGPTGNGSPNI